MIKDLKFTLPLTSKFKFQCQSSQVSSSSITSTDLIQYGGVEGVLGKLVEAESYLSPAFTSTHRRCYRPFMEVLLT
jgi:hypothetical protein